MSKTKTPNIFKLNSKKKIYHLFSIPPCAQDPYYDFSKHYEYGFLHKCKNKEVDFLSLDQIKATFVTEKISEKDRPIVKHKKDSIWIKKAQRFLHKCIVKLLRETPYLHSTIKRSSYATNGRSHANGENKFMFVVDISSYFQGINKQRVIKGLKNFLCVDGDVANFYASLVTVKKDINSEEMVLGQGLPSSPIIAFICYKSLFDFIYKHAKESGIDFTLYVDDMAFSSDKEIPQSFINKILGILKSKQYDNKLVINNDKIKLYKKECIKKITGVYIKNGLPKISNRKHHEIFLLYKFLIKQMSEGIGDLDEHFLFLNYFVKFSGNLMHLFQVEYGNNFKIENISNHAHKMMLMFYRDVSKILRISFGKTKVGEPYSKDNIKPEYFKILREQFKLLDENIDHLYEKYKFCSCSTSKPITT